MLNSFKRQHNAEDGELSDYTKHLMSHLPQLYNRTQRREVQRTPLSTRELNEMSHKLQPRKTPGVDGPSAELYRRLPLHLKRHLPARLWLIAIGRVDMPPDWANLVHPLYKKGDWANPDNWRPIVCATTDTNLIWMLILKQVASVVNRAIPPTICGAIRGRSPLEAILMQDAVVDMDPISLIITSLDFQGAFANTPHRLLQAIWEHMGLPFQGFLQVYLATRLYAVQTDIGTTPWTHPTSGVPQGGAEDPFLFLLVTLPLTFYIRRTYPDVAPYPLRTTLLAFADDMGFVPPPPANPSRTPQTTSGPTRYSTIVPTTWKTTGLWYTASSQPPWYKMRHPHFSAPATHPCPRRTMQPTWGLNRRPHWREAPYHPTWNAN